MMCVVIMHRHAVVPSFDGVHTCKPPVKMSWLMRSGYRSRHGLMFLQPMWKLQGGQGSGQGLCKAMRQLNAVCATAQRQTTS